MRKRGFELVPVEFRKNGITVEPILPQRGTAHSAGYDFATPVDVTIPPRGKALIWTDVCSYMQEGEVLSLHVRSSLGIKKGLRLANVTGIIDMDYYANIDNHGNIGICLANDTDDEVFLQAGERIVQGIFNPFLVSDNCNTEDVREGGIGSTTK